MSDLVDTIKTYRVELDKTRRNMEDLTRRYENLECRYESLESRYHSNHFFQQVEARILNVERTLIERRSIIQARAERSKPEHLERLLQEEQPAHRRSQEELEQAHQATTILSTQTQGFAGPSAPKPSRRLAIVASTTLLADNSTRHFPRNQPATAISAAV